MTVTVVAVVSFGDAPLSPLVREQVTADALPCRSTGLDAPIVVLHCQLGTARKRARWYPA